MSTPFRLQIPRSLYDAMIVQAFAELPNECCGLLAGPAGGAGELPVVRVTRRYPLVNAAASPVEFWSEPRSLFHAVKDMRSLGIDLVCVYHSHPTSAPVPSRTDLERHSWPGAMTLIISCQATQPEARAWWLSGQDYRPGEFEVV